MVDAATTTVKDNPIPATFFQFCCHHSFFVVFLINFTTFLFNGSLGGSICISSGLVGSSLAFLRLFNFSKISTYSSIFNAEMVAPSIETKLSVDFTSFKIFIFLFKSSYSSKFIGDT